MTSISIQSDADRIAKKVDQMHKRQIPFALSLAVNSVAFDVRRRIVEKTYPRSFDVKSRTFAKQAFRVIKSNKRQQPITATVHDRFDKQWLIEQRTGGAKSKRSRYFAIPVTIKRGTTGKITSRNKPRSLPNTFVADLKTGGAGIFQRKGRGKRKKVTLAYVLKPQVILRPRFPFFKDGKSTAARSFPFQMRRALKKAIDTAR